MLSTDGLVAPVAATLQPSQLMPANQKAWTVSSGPNLVATDATASPASMSSVMAPDGIPKAPRWLVSWYPLTGPSSSSSSCAGVRVSSSGDLVDRLAINCSRLRQGA